jgi:hypothetical protein
LWLSHPLMRSLALLQFKQPGNGIEFYQCDLCVNFWMCNSSRRLLSKWPRACPVGKMIWNCDGVQGRAVHSSKVSSNHVFWPREPRHEQKPPARGGNRWLPASYRRHVQLGSEEQHLGRRRYTLQQAKPAILLRSYQRQQKQQSTWADKPPYRPFGAFQVRQNNIKWRLQCRFQILSLSSTTHSSDQHTVDQHQ